MKITESQLKKIIRETIEESVFGLSLDNRVKNGRWREESRSDNDAVKIAYRNGWVLTKKSPEPGVEGIYDAEIMSGFANNYKPDANPSNEIHPKVSWPMLVAILNKELRPSGFTVAASKYRETNVDLMGNETGDGSGAGTMRGTIKISR